MRNEHGTSYWLSVFGVGLMVMILIGCLLPYPLLGIDGWGPERTVKAKVNRVYVDSSQRQPGRELPVPGLPLHPVG